jgi:hypothetical protein
MMRALWCALLNRVAPILPADRSRLDAMDAPRP